MELEHIEIILTSSLNLEHSSNILITEIVLKDIYYGILRCLAMFLLG